MTMTDLHRELYEMEILKIRRDLKVPDEMPVFILDVVEEQVNWIPLTDLPDEESKKARAMFLASQNREEGGE